MSKKIALALVSMIILVAWTSTSRAETKTFSIDIGDHQAQAVFDLTGTTLKITLTNLSTAAVEDPTDVLTALFFSNTHSLTPVSANLNGSTVLFGSLVNNVGEGWQFLSGSGISAAGLGIFGPDGNFFSPAVKVDGLAYGILGTGDLSGANKGVTDHGPLIQNSVQFVLTAGAGFTLAELGDVQFNYGTGELPPISSPEPSLIILLGIGLVAVSLITWRMKV